SLLFSDEQDSALINSGRQLPEEEKPPVKEVSVFAGPVAGMYLLEDQNTWKVLIVDDEEDIHQVTRLALRTFSYKSKNIEFIDAYSAKEAADILKANKDIAIILLDVVMETNNAGLDLVKEIRENIGNYITRIILRTGQPGQAPEKDVINKYEINDYKTKTELTQDKLYTVIMAGLRAFESLITIDSYRQNLEVLVEERTHELALANKELEKLSVVASKTDNAVAILNSKGDFEWINDGFSRLYEFTFDEFLNNEGRNIFTTIPKSYINDDGQHDPDGEDVKKIIECIQKAMDEKKPYSYEFSTITKSGKRVIVNTTITPILDEKGALYKLIAIDSDITKIKQAEAEIKKQKEEITDSILYAKRIQSAILPAKFIDDSIIRDHFILYLPRDIVSGDFYWFTKVGKVTVIAVADCTGHGVPGAFMSMLGITLFNEIVNKAHITRTGDVLNELRNNILSSFKQNTVLHANEKHNETKHRISALGQVRDGMDIALIAIENDTKKCQFSGAINSLFLVRGNEIIEYKGDKMPVALHENMQPFSTTDFQLEPDDRLYLFSDGFIDQFGGPEGKKIKSKPFKEILISNHKKSMTEQKLILKNTLEDWMNHVSRTNGKPYEQIDDITVLGIRV
ncbi:MAG: SpoIIE family protein phosphatase, partial [Bacteroidetes bacterium]|nr:SpoIIE family protein phosphatase [Bacteroidota bacterium]